MLDRRRLARFLVLALAGLAVAGTSYPGPSPGPTQRLDLRGSLHLTAASPVAFQPLEVAIEAGRVDTIAFSVTLGAPPDEGALIVTIEPVRGTARAASHADMATPPPGGPTTVNARFRGPCASPCTEDFALVVSWIGAPQGGALDIAWTLAATTRFMPSDSTGTPPPGRVAITVDEARAPESEALTSVTSDKPIRLTETDRFRAWTVVLQRRAPNLTDAPDRALTQARLSAVVVQTDGDPFGSETGKDRREEARTDPPVQVRLVGGSDGPAWRWASDAPLTFDPFLTCAPDVACQRTLTIELAWADGRPQTAFDAAWTLDLVNVAPNGSVEPIEASIGDLATPRLATATATGSFEGRGRTGRAESEFVARAGVALDVDTPWTEIGLPVRGRVTARVTALAGSSFPPDAIVQVVAFGSQSTSPALGTTVDVRVGEEATFAFEPGLSCAAGRPNGCEIHGVIGAMLVSPTPNATGPVLGYRVDWTLDLGAAVTDDGGFEIRVDPSPSSSP